jgi:hypothetical protein
MVGYISLFFSVRNFTSCCVISVPVWEFHFLLLHTLTVAVLCEAIQKERLYISDEQRQWPRCMGTVSVDWCVGNRWFGNRRTSQHECIYSCVHTVCKVNLYSIFSVSDWPVISSDNPYKYIGASVTKASLQCIILVVIFMSNMTNLVSTALLYHFLHSFRHNWGV